MFPTCVAPQVRGAAVDAEQRGGAAERQRRHHRRRHPGGSRPLHRRQDVSAGPRGEPRQIHEVIYT